MIRITPNTAFVILGCLALTVLATLSTATAQEVAKEPTSSKSKSKDSAHFVRIRRDYRNRQVALETSITRYICTNDQGQQVNVDLIGAVHIGEKEYFEKLNDRFEPYDSLLFELVAPKGTVIPKGGRSEGGVPTNPLAALQKGMQAGLELAYQLEHIDYSKDNFVHADLSPEELSQSMVENDESVVGFGLKAIGQGIAMNSSGKNKNSLDMVMLAISSNKKYRMRKIFAKQLQSMEAGMVVFQGKNGSSIIGQRNARCLEVLKEEMDKGKTNIGIFYGAAHFPDMQQRLFDDFKAQRAGQAWLEAWKLRDTE